MELSHVGINVFSTCSEFLVISETIVISKLPFKNFSDYQSFRVCKICQYPKWEDLSQQMEDWHFCPLPLHLAHLYRYGWEGIVLAPVNSCFTCYCPIVFVNENCTLLWGLSYLGAWPLGRSQRFGDSRCIYKFLPEREMLAFVPCFWASCL